MADIEKAIKGLEVCFDSSKECNGCPYIATPYCKTTLRNDVTVLLKEQDAVEPKHNPLSPTDWFCGKCGMCISRFHDYCPSCGQAVKWE